MALHVPEVERPVKECLVCGQSNGTLRLFQLEDPRERLDIDEGEGKMYDARTKTWIIPTLYFQDVNPPEHRNGFYLHYTCRGIGSIRTAVGQGVIYRSHTDPNLVQCKPTYAYKAVAHFKREVKVLIKENLGKKALRKFNSLLKPHPKFFCNIRTHTTESGCEWHYLPDYCWWVQQILDKLKDEMDELAFQVASVVNPPESYRMRKQAKKPRKASVKPRRESIDPTLLWQLDARAIQTIYDFLFWKKGWDRTSNVERVRPNGVIFRDNIIGTISRRYINYKNRSNKEEMINTYLRSKIRKAMGFNEEHIKVNHVRVECTSPEAQQRWQEAQRRG